MAKYFCLLIATVTFLLANEGFILRYKLFSYDHIDGGQHFTISRIMSKKEGYKKSFNCYITDDREIQEDTLIYLQRHKDDLVECVLKSGIYVNAKSKTDNLQSKTTTTLIKKPTYFTVDFNEGFAKIQLFISK